MKFGTVNTNFWTCHAITR